MSLTRVAIHTGSRELVYKWMRLRANLVFQKLTGNDYATIWLPIWSINGLATGKTAELDDVGLFPGLMGAWGPLGYSWFVPCLLPLDSKLTFIILFTLQDVVIEERSSAHTLTHICMHTLRWPTGVPFPTCLSTRRLTFYQFPSTFSHRLLALNDLLSIIGPQRFTFDYWPSTIYYRLLALDDLPSIIGPRQLALDDLPSIIGPRRFTVEELPPTIGLCSTIRGR